MASHTVLIAASPFADMLDGAQAAGAVGRGLAAESQVRCAPARWQIDACPLAHVQENPQAGARGLLDSLAFDERMRAAHAVVIAQGCLDHTTLPGSPAFEIATRARQGGVPCYAIAAHNRLDSFEARILDLQVVLQAATQRALTAAGRRLAKLI